MRRDDFLKSLLAMAAAGSLPMGARAAGANLKMMWDLLSRRRPVLGHHDDSLDRALQS